MGRPMASQIGLKAIGTRSKAMSGSAHSHPELHERNRSTDHGGGIQRIRLGMLEIFGD